jgi:hypothetical protein
MSGMSHGIETVIEVVGKEGGTGGSTGAPDGQLEFACAP